METKYYVNDVIYYINDFRVIKVVVDEIVIKIDTKGTHVSYTVSTYKKDNKAKTFSCVEAYLVSDIETARKSALTNWDRITTDVYKQIKEFTDEIFEPKEEDDSK